MIIYDITTDRTLEIKHKHIFNQVDSYSTGQLRLIAIKLVVNLPISEGKRDFYYKPVVVQYLFTANKIVFIKSFSGINLAENAEGRGVINVKYE